MQVRVLAFFSTRVSKTLNMVASDVHFGNQIFKDILKDARTSFFLSFEFRNFWICCTLWVKTKGNIKRNWLFSLFLLLETNR